jgi:hypothetical protein
MTEVEIPACPFKTQPLLLTANIRVADQNVAQTASSAKGVTILDAIIPRPALTLYAAVSTSDIKQPSTIALEIKVHITHAAHTTELEVVGSGVVNTIFRRLARDDMACAIAIHHTVAVIVIRRACYRIIFNAATPSRGDRAWSSQDMKVGCDKTGKAKSGEELSS